MQKGFTLIELMITVAIIGILAAIAIPNYNAYVRKARMTDAFNQLSTYALRLEQNFQNNATYVSSGTTCSPAVSSLSSSDFAFTCTGSATDFTATATGTGKMLNYIFTIDAAGTRRTTRFGGSSNLATALTCWSTSGSC